jgi:hypothetical protein
MAMQTDLMIRLEDRPGAVADVAETLGSAGINIEGATGFVAGGQGVMHVLLGDPAVVQARAALDAARIAIEAERRVWVMQCPDRPGELGRVMRNLGRADVNCNLIYLTTTGQLVVGAEDVESVRSVLG